MPKLTIRGGEIPDREIELADRDLRIGRGEQNDVVLTDPTKSVSRLHAELRQENGAYVLLDLNSQNGLWVRGRREQKITLEVGVPVTIGTYTISLAGVPVPDSDMMRPGPVGRPVNTSDTLIPSDGERPAAKPAAAPVSAARHRTAAPGKPGAAPALGLIAALARIPKPMLFGGFAAFMILIMALGQLFAPADKPSGGVTTAASAPARPPSPSNKDLRDQHVTSAKSLLEKNDYDAAIKELDDALVAMPGDPEAVDLKAKTTEARTLPVSQVAGQPATGQSGAAGPTPPTAGSAPATPASPPTQPAANPPVSTRTTSTPPGDRSARNPPPPTGPPLSIGCRPGETRADCATRGREIADRYELAKTAFDGGSFQAAIAQFTDVARDEPGYKDVALLIALAREGLRTAAQQALDAGTKAESGGDWVAALQHYQRAPQIDSATVVVAEESVKRVRARMKTEGADAFTRARQYDAVGRIPEALALYDRALRYLPDDDANKKTAKERLDALRLRQ